MHKIVLLFFLIINSTLVSQTIEFTIFDKKTNEVIPYVNVLIQNSTKGWSGNEKGIVKIDFTKLELSDTLIFSAVGYGNYKIKIDKIKATNRVFLSPSLVKLKEGNGFYTFYFSQTVGGKLLLQNGELKMMVERTSN